MPWTISVSVCAIRSHSPLLTDAGAQPLAVSALILVSHDYTVNIANISLTRSGAATL